MTMGRLFRTVRHLTAEQWLYRFVCRGQRLVMRYLPGRSRRRIGTAAETLPLPDPEAPRLAAICRDVLELQQAVHGEHLDGIPEGRFTLLNRTLDFGGLDAVAWRRDLGEGNNPLWRMNLAYMGYAVPLLARGGRAELEVVLRLLRGLEDQNGWSLPGVFRDVWNAYTASHRLINLLAGLALYRAAHGEVSEEEQAELLRHVRFCAAFVRANLERDLQFNHLLKNYVALATYGAALERPPAPFAVLRAGVPASLRQQILADGGHAERCPMYHLLAILDLRILRESGLFAEEWQPLLDGNLARMEAAMPVMCHPDGDVALLNDSWLGEAPPAAAVVDMAPAAGVSRLPETGYVRLAGGGDSIVFDCGPCGPDSNPGHAHADFLSIEAAVGGHRFIVDPGVPTYTSGRARDWCRSAASHNGPHVAGAEPIEFWGSFRVGRRGTAAAIANDELDGLAPLWCAGGHTGYRHLGVAVRRYVGLWPGRALLIVDLWMGPSGAARLSNFLVAADPAGDRALQAGQSFVGPRGTVAAVPLIGALAPPSAAAWWPRFGVEAPAQLLALSAEEESAERSRAAVLFDWSGQITAPGPEALARICRGLQAG